MIAPWLALAQCSMCQQVVNGSVEGRDAISDLNAGILLMFFAPYLVVGGSALYFGRRRVARWLRARLRRRPVPSPTPAGN